MKTNPATLLGTTMISAGVLACLLVFSQPASGQPARPPRIDPANGMPIPANQSNHEVILYEHSMSSDLNMASIELHELIYHGRYVEALQLCHEFHDLVKNSSSSEIIPGWIELGRRYPKAKADLVEILDHDLREFAEGRGYRDLFLEVNAINHGWNRDDSTYALFNTLREKDPDLAQQCYLDAEGLLVARGEYQWCYDHMGDPQGKFEAIRHTMDFFLAFQKGVAESHQYVVRKMAASGLTNFVPADYASVATKRFARDGFIGGTRQMIEILVATGHKSDAEKIRDEAVAILDNPRLRSAVSDAEEKIQKLSIPNKK